MNFNRKHNLEVTTFIKNISFGKKHYFEYLRGIVKKRKLVRDINENFCFIQKKLNKKETKFVNQNIKRKDFVV